MHMQSQCCIITTFMFESFALCFVLSNLKSSYLVAFGIINLLAYLHIFRGGVQTVVGCGESFIVDIGSRRVPRSMQQNRL